MGWIQVACTIIGTCASIIAPISGGLDAYLNPETLYDFTKEPSTAQISTVDYDTSTRLANAIRGILHGTDNAAGIDAFEDFTKQKSAQKDVLEKLKPRKITASGNPPKTPKRYTLDHERTIADMRKRMPDGSKEYFDSALNAGQNNRVKLLPKDETVYVSGSDASGNFVSPTHPGLDSREIMEDYQLPASNRADVVREMRTTRPQLAIESDVASQPEWAKQAGYEARTGNKQYFIPNSNTEGAVADGRLEEVGREYTDYNSHLPVPVDNGEEENQNSDYEEKQQAVDEKYDSQINAVNAKQDENIRQIDSVYEDKTEKINNAPLTAKEKERLNENNAEQRCSSKNALVDEGKAAKDELAQQRYDEKQKNINEEYIKSLNENYDRHQENQNKIIQEYAEKNKEIDDKYDRQEQELKSKIDRELKDNENQAQVDKKETESVQSSQSEGNGKSEYQENKTHQVKAEKVVDNTETIEKYKAEHDKIEAARNDEKTKNNVDCTNKLQENNRQYELKNEAAKKERDARSEKNAADLNREKERNASEADAAKKQNNIEKENAKNQTAEKQNDARVGNSMDNAKNNHYYNGQNM